MFELIFGIVSAVCTIVILVDVFKRSLIGGLICLFCWLYYVFYAIFEFKHEHKLLIVLDPCLAEV